MASSAILSIKPLGFLWETKNPFLFCAHHNDAYPRGNDSLGPDTSLTGRNLGNDFTVKDGWRMYHGRKVPGFPAHPHRGFETVTIVLEGFIDHSDSLSAACRYGNGDVQWMAAGKGVQHSEMFPLLNKDKDNPLELFQIWLNLPSSGKSAEPDYLMFWKEDIPVHTTEDNEGRKTEITLIAGKSGDKRALQPPSVSWAADVSNEVNIWIINMEPGSEYELAASKADVSRVLYFYSGNSIRVAGEEILSGSSIELKSDIQVILQSGPEHCSLLMLQGKAINEPVVQYGPFVVNTKKEIQETLDEYNRTQFGGWPWPENEQVHDRYSGRFAKYPDGRNETRPF